MISSWTYIVASITAHFGSELLDRSRGGFEEDKKKNQKVIMTRHSVNSARHWTITVSANETGGDKGNSPRTAMAKRLDRQEVKMNLSSRQ